VTAEVAPFAHGCQPVSRRFNGAARASGFCGRPSQQIYFVLDHLITKLITAIVYVQSNSMFLCELLKRRSSSASGLRIMGHTRESF
jgi:hypothetical protein